MKDNKTYFYFGEDGLEISTDMNDSTIYITEDAIKFDDASKRTNLKQSYH